MAILRPYVCQYFMQPSSSKSAATIIKKCNGSSVFVGEDGICYKQQFLCVIIARQSATLVCSFGKLTFCDFYFSGWRE